MLTLGIDIGTTSICIVCYDQRTDRILKSVQGTNRFLEEGSFLQNPDRILETAKGLLLEMLEWLFCSILQGEEKREIAGIGISSQMHGILYVDNDGKAVSPFYTWKNEYGNEVYREGKTYAEYVTEQTGLAVYSGFGSVTHFYLKEHNLIPQKAAGFVNIGDYLAMALTGSSTRAAVPSMAASFGGFNLKNQEFEWERLSLAGIDTEFYPLVVRDPEAGVYRVKNRKSIPVFHAIGDNQASFLGAVRNRADTVSINVGTGSQVSVYGKELFPASGLEVRPFVGQGYLYVGASLNGGKVYERLGIFLKEICEEFTGQSVDIYQKMELVGRKKKQTDLQTVISLYGTRNGSGKQAGIYHITHENFHGADLIRSFAAGMAGELYELYQLFPGELTAGKKQITASGNGIRKNKLLQEEIEKQFKLPITFTHREEEAAAGAAQYVCEVMGKRGIPCRL